MIKKMDVTFTLWDENGNIIISDYKCGTAYDILGLEKSLNAIRILLEEDLKIHELE